MLSVSLSTADLQAGKMYSVRPWAFLPLLRLSMSLTKPSSLYLEIVVWVKPPINKFNGSFLSSSCCYYLQGIFKVPLIQPIKSLTNAMPLFFMTVSIFSLKLPPLMTNDSKGISELPQTSNTADLIR